MYQGNKKRGKKTLSFFMVKLKLKVREEKHLTAHTGGSGSGRILKKEI
jgi:hypothetical protein